MHFCTTWTTQAVEGLGGKPLGDPHPHPPTTQKTHYKNPHVFMVNEEFRTGTSPDVPGGTEGL